jgi:xylulokinase
MNKMKFLGIDIGTTSLKAALFDEDGKRIALTNLDYTLSTDPATGFIEFDAPEYVRMCRQVIDEFTAQYGQIDAMSVDTQGETMILTDEEGTPLYPAIVWLDNRAEREAEDMKAHFGNKLVYEVTGQPEITAGWPGCKLLWMKHNRPEVWEKTRKIFLLEDWILYSLTGNFVTEPTIQSSSIYMDIRTRTWWGEMLDYIGICECMLPKIEKSAKVIGEYKGIAVVTGALDQIAGSIGAGVTDRTKISEMTGTIMAISALTGEIPPYNPESIIPCHLHVIDGEYCLLLWSSTAGMALKWFREQFAKELSFKEIDEIAAPIPAGCEGMTMLPYFCGSTMPKYNPTATATFTGVTLSHTKAHFARAIMEAIAFTLQQDLQYIGAGDVEELRITGGAASSPLWSGIKANVTGKRLCTLSESETACLGTAILAAVGIGVYPDVRTAAEKIVHTKKAYVPTGDDYTEAFKRYCELDEKLNG